MFHDILFALLGLTGDIIILSTDPIFQQSTFRITDGYSLIHEAEKEQINQILPLGWYYQQFQHFLQQYNLTWNLAHQQLSVYKMALSLAIQDLLQEYEGTVSELEELYNRNLSNLATSPSSFSEPLPSLSHSSTIGSSVVSYNTLIIYLKNYEMIFPHLYLMLLQIEQQGITGCQIIDFFAKCPIGNPVFQDVIDRILFRLRTVLLKQVFAWMIFGDLQDESKEFFIQAKEALSSTALSGFDAGNGGGVDPQFLSSNYTEQRMLQRLLQVKQQSENSGGAGSNASSFEWSSGYLLRLERLPDSHISPNLASKILFTGKAILLLQESQSYQKSVKKDDALHHHHVASSRGSVFHYLSQGHSFHAPSDKRENVDDSSEEEDEEDDNSNDGEDLEDTEINEKKTNIKEKTKSGSETTFNSSSPPSSAAASSLLLGFQQDEIEYLDQQFHSLLQLSSSQQFIPKLEVLLSSIYNCISNRLWNYMKDEYGFLHYLQIIRNTYLMGKGEFFQNILDDIYPLTFPPTASSSSSSAAGVVGKLPSQEEMDEILNWKILRNATKLISLDDDEMLHLLNLKIDLSAIQITRFTEQNIHYFSMNGSCQIEYPHTAAALAEEKPPTTKAKANAAASSVKNNKKNPPPQSPLHLKENIYEPVNILFNIKHTVKLSNLFMKLWSEKNQLQSMYLYNTINNPWNPLHNLPPSNATPSTADGGMAAGTAAAAATAPSLDLIYLNGSLWLKDAKFIQKGFQYSLTFTTSWININRYLTLYHPYFRANHVKDKKYWPKFQVSSSASSVATTTNNNNTENERFSIIDHRESDVVLGSMAICLQNDPRTIHSQGKGELSRDIHSSIMVGVSFHAYTEIEEETKAHRLKYYARLYVIRGSMEGSWKLPTDRRVNLHIGGGTAATANHNASSAAPIGGNGADATAGSYYQHPDEYLLAEKIINLDSNLFVESNTKGAKNPTASSNPLKSLNTFDKMKLEVEYVRALQYHPAGSANSVTAGGKHHPFLNSTTAGFSSSKQMKDTTSNTIFSEYQKRVQLTGDVSYRLRVRLNNEDTMAMRDPSVTHPIEREWDLEIPLDMTFYVKLTGGQCYVGAVTSGLYFPPSSGNNQNISTNPSNPSKQSSGFFGHIPTIDQLSPSKHSRQHRSEEEIKGETAAAAAAASSLDHSFYLRLYSLFFQNRTSIQSFPICSAFTATRFPDTQLRLEKELSSMKLWLHIKLQYSFNILLKVIFDIESIRNYERVFSLIMKIRMVSRLLEKLWMSRSKWMMTDRVFCHLRHSMHFFISNLLYYLQVDVVDSEYSDLIREIHALQSSSSSKGGRGGGGGETAAHHPNSFLHVGSFFTTANTASTSSNDFQVILRIHKKFLANILKLSMIDHLGIQETIDRILHICLRFIACCRIQSASDIDFLAIGGEETAGSGGTGGGGGRGGGGGGGKSPSANAKKKGSGDGEGTGGTDRYTYIPSEEFENIQKEFSQHISLLFQSMKSLDSRGFLFRLDFNNYLSNQIMQYPSHPPHQHHQPPPPPAAAVSQYRL